MENSKPLVSVIMAVYNGERFLKQAITSALAQTYTNIELLIINDCSVDNSQSIIESFNDPRIKVFKNEKNENYTYSLNVGVAHSSGKYIAILDQDDQWLPNKIEKQISYLEKNTNTSACFTLVNVVDENNNLWTEDEEPLVSLFRQENRSRYKWLHDLLLNGNRLCHPSVVYRKDAIVLHGAYDYSILQWSDFELYLRFLQDGELYIIQEPLMLYRRLHGDNTSLSNVHGKSEYRARHEYSMIVSDYVIKMSPKLFNSVFSEEIECEKDNNELSEYNKGYLLYTKFKDEKIKDVGLRILRNIFSKEAGLNYIRDNIGIRQTDYYNWIAYKDIQAEYEETNKYVKGLEKTNAEMLDGWREAVSSIDVLKNELNTIRIQYESTIKNDELLKQKLRTLEDNQSSLEKSREDIINKYHQAELDRQNLLNIINLMESSTSWKMTSPFRTIMRQIKRIIGKSARKVYQSIKKEKNKPVAALRQYVSAWPPKNLHAAEGESVPLGDNASRIAIYHFYDGEGHIDNYVLYFLKELRKVASRIIFVSNGSLGDGDMNLVKEYADDIVVRDNSGFDAWGMKAGIERIGFDELEKYDELLMVNSTFFGPVSDIKKVFDTMETQNIDFWGIASHPGFDIDPFKCNPYGCVPPHVQTYWMCVRNRMIKSEPFKEFWKQLPEIRNYNEAVGYYETVFTKFFSDYGFKWSTYIDSSVYEALTDNPLIATPVESIRDMGCPIIKWRAFFQDYDYLTTYTGQHTAMYLMDYIRDHLDYPIEYVWEYLIRTRHMSDLVRNIHLAEILESTRYDGLINEHEIVNHSVALFMHLYDTSMADELARYAGNMPDHADIWISTTSEEKKEIIQNVFSVLSQNVYIRVCPNRGRDVSALLASFNDVVMNYEIICVTHDKKTSYLKPETVGEGFAYMGYENILSSKEFVKNVINAFCENKFLGLLYSPDPNHADFGSHIGLEWGGNFEATKHLAEELKLNVPIDEKHPPCAPFGSNFWIRTRALAPLYNKDWTYEDFPAEPIKETDGTIMHAVERIYPYCAQSQGYYSALLMTNEYSAIELGNLSHYAETYAHVCFDNGLANRYHIVRDSLDQLIGPVTVDKESDSAAAIMRSMSFKNRAVNKIKRKLIEWASL